MFRAVVIASLGLCLPIGLYFRIKSQATRERLDRRQEGLVIMIGLRLCGVLAWIVMAAYLMNAAWLSGFSVALPVWLRSCGAPLALVVVPLLLFWTFHSLGRNLTDTVVTRREHTLSPTAPIAGCVIRFMALFVCGGCRSPCSLPTGSSPPPLSLR